MKRPSKPSRPTIWPGTELSRMSTNCITLLVRPRARCRMHSYEGGGARNEPVPAPCVSTAQPRSARCQAGQRQETTVLSPKRSVWGVVVEPEAESMCERSEEKEDKKSEASTTRKEGAKRGAQGRNAWQPHDLCQSRTPQRALHAGVRSRHRTKEKRMAPG